MADPPHSWAHSYPRSSHKVLPERVPGQKLRLTQNGNILQNGGTLSGRKQQQFPDDHQFRPRSSSQGSQPEPNNKIFYGSEPDLRFTGRDYQSHSNDSPAKLRISRSRKKYKAPTAPHNNNNSNNTGVDSSSPDSYQHWEITGEIVPPVRRLRLFKTKAETNKRRGQEENSQFKQNSSSPSPSAASLQRSLSSPQFQAELLEAAERLRPVREPPVGKAAESPVLRAKDNFYKPTAVLQSTENISNSPKIDRVRQRNAFKPNYHETSHDSRNFHKHSENKISSALPQLQKSNITKDDMARNRNKNNRPIVDHRPRGEMSIGKDSVPEQMSGKHNRNNSWDIIPTTKPSAPVKTFYFGMSECTMNGGSGSGEDNHEVDRFAASLQRQVPPYSPSPHLNHTANTSGSDSLSSEGLDDCGNGISLQLRPILPRKQLDIPRFSPTAAWRLLSALESPPPSEEDDLVPLEERIPVPPLPLHIHPDKSGDSGISGDASPQHQDSTHNSQAAWTPQQDLEETSSDGGLESAPVSPESLPAAKFSPRFSLSLPRDDRMASYTQPEKMRPEGLQLDSFQSLKKLRRSMSGALGRSNGKESSSPPLDGNWVLSRSVPNSLNNGHVSLHRWSNSSPSSPDQEDEMLMTSLVKQPSFSYLATGGHVMYLPEYSVPHQQRETKSSSLPTSKSCEDLSQKEQITPSVARALEAPRTRSGRKFTFQSTVRQIERRRLAEKLSKEAEQKERQRLGELEAMRRVEEEFQRKREREKADIRQQLRLYSLTQGARAQPDGADPPPPPATQVLSEYRQPRRDYRDYTPQNRGYHESDTVPVAETSPKRATVHPQVVYQMPKSTQVYVNPHLHSNGSGVGSVSGDGGGLSTPRSSSSDNYRRDFAQGALPHSLVSSDSEISQPNTRPTSRNLHRSRF